jgi:7-dehydrocholesterol reductase
MNGLSAWIATHTLYFTLSYAGVLDPSFIPRHWSSLIAAMNLAGVLVTTFAYLKAHFAPTHPRDRKFSGQLRFH